MSSLILLIIIVVSAALLTADTATRSGQEEEKAEEVNSSSVPPEDENSIENGNNNTISNVVIEPMRPPRGNLTHKEIEQENSELSAPENENTLSNGNDNTSLPTLPDTLIEPPHPPERNLTLREIRRRNAAMHNDLKFTPEQKAQLKQRMAALQAYFWPGGVVPYVLDASYNSLRADLIGLANREFSKYTCIKLIPRRNTDRNYIIIAASNGCNAHFGMVGGGQVVNMSPYCNNWPQVILHEIGHALGLIHEQQRPDRDNYVQIMWQNINRNMQYNFNFVPVKTTKAFAYDYNSMMHYDNKAFSSNGGDAMVAKAPYSQYTRTMGWYNTMSRSDIDRINFYYNCRVGKK